MEKSFLFNKDYKINNLNKLKSHSDNESGLPSIVPLISLVLLIPTASVSNSTNCLSDKQPVIQDVQGKGDVNMSNEKSMSTQEVRQQDLDSLEKLFNEKLKTSTTYFDGKFDTLSQKIEGIKSNIDKEADRRYKRTNLLITVIGIVVPVVVQIIFKFIK